MAVEQNPRDCETGGEGRDEHMGPDRADGRRIGSHRGMEEQK